MQGDPLSICSRELRELHDYWKMKKGAKLAPTRRDVVPAEIKSHLPRIFLVDVVGAPPRFRFRLAGTEVVERFGEEITGRFLDELDLDAVNQEISNDYRKVVASSGPVCSRWTYTKHDGKLLRYERLLLPLSSDGSSIDMILGGAFAEALPAASA